MALRQETEKSYALGKNKLWHVHINKDDNKENQGQLIIIEVVEVHTNRHAHAIRFFTQVTSFVALKS